MKIEKIIINNFRIFNGRNEFNFMNKYLVVISGPNGNGKSTIFDSIQWCFTGKIPRYEGSNERQRFNYIMNEYTYREAGAQSMSVEVWVRLENGSRHKICRLQKKNRKGRLETPEVIVDDESLNLTDGAEKIGNILSNIEIEELNEKKQEKVMNLSTFFSSTQLLSQDALHNFIRADKPSERYKLIDKVLGVKKYGEDFEQFIELIKITAQEQHEQLSQELISPKEELDRLSIQLSEKEKLNDMIGEVKEEELLERTKEIITKFINAGVTIPESAISIQKLNNQVIEALVTLRREAKEEQEKIEQLKLRIQNASEIMSLTPELYHAEKKNIDQTIKSLKKRKEHRLQGIEIVRRRQTALDLLKVRRERFQETLKEYNTLSQKKNEKENEKQMIHLHEALAKTKKLYPETQKFTQIYRQQQLELDEVDTFLKFYELDEIVNRLNNEIQNELTNLQEKKQIHNSKDIMLTNILEQIEEIDNTLSVNKASLIDELIRQVQGHLIHSEGDEICPICGTDFESPQALHFSISSQIEKGNLLLSEFERKRLNLLEKKSMFEEDIRKLHIETNQLENLLIQKEERANSISVEREMSRSMVTETIAKLNKEQLLTKKLDYEQFFNEFKLSYELLASLKLIKTDIDALDEEIELKLQVLESLKKESNRWANYLEMEQINIDKRLQLITNYFAKVKEESLHQELEKKILTNRLTLLEDQWNQRNKVIVEINKDIPSFTGKLPELEYWLNDTSNKVNTFSELDGKLGAHLSKLHIFLSKDKVVELKNDVVALNATVKERIQQIESYKEFIVNELDYLKKEHISVQSDLIGDYLLQHSDYVDQLFMQISPHAVYRHVQLVPKDKNLYVVMTKQSAKEYDLRQLNEDRLKQQFNASLTFSSAQANVLAICIFLALNRSQKWTKLKLLGIDDPFQNLDDINVFSFIDVLSQVIETQNKQVLISTHSEDFAQLLKVKMNLKPEQIGTIVFKSYSEKGAVITGSCVVEDSK
ncbi:MAG: AAA family ATPase [Bacillota bacterium]